MTTYIKVIYYLKNTYVGCMCLSDHLMYTKLAKYYDVIYRDYLKSMVPKLVDAYVECFKRFARRGVKEVLDIACGTGGPTIELAKRGYSVVGADLHEEVIELAREKAKKLGLNVNFVVCDARELDKVFSSDSFDAVTMFFTSIAYMTKLDDLIKLLKSVKYVLRDGGIFVADSPNPYEFMFRLGSGGGEGRPITWNVKGLEKGEYLILTDWKEMVDWVNCVNKFKRLITIIEEGGVSRSYLVSDTLRLYTATEFMLTANLVGFNKSRVMCYSGGKLLDLSSGGRCGRLLFIAIA